MYRRAKIHHSCVFLKSIMNFVLRTGVVSLKEGKLWSCLLPCTDMETTSKELHQSSAELRGQEEIPNALSGGSTSLSAVNSSLVLAGILNHYDYRRFQCLQALQYPLTQIWSSVLEGTSYFLFISVEKTTKKKTFKNNMNLLIALKLAVISPGLIQLDH